MGMMMMCVRTEGAGLAVGAGLLRLEQVSVTIHKSKFKDEDQALRIVENLKRHTVTVDEAIKAVKELDLIYGSAGFGYPNHGSVSEATGCSPEKISVLRTLADLVPALSQLLTDKIISQRVAAFSNLSRALY